ncbi:MAG: arylsulfotransferase family protein, partial [Rickettsiales bacterium]|nr:arylsulfotransferase family protein [Rickettsiales bacterium]
DDLAAKSEETIQNPEVEWNQAKAENGYTLVSTGYLSFPFLVDMNGKLVYRWHIPIEKVWSAAGCTNMFKMSIYFVDRAHLYPNGDILAQFADWGAPYGCGMIKVNKEGEILWVYESFVHHDSTLDERGNIYTIVQKTLTDPEPGFEHLPYPMTADYLVKISPEGREEKRISVMHAFKNTPYELMIQRGKGDGDDEYDFFHTNSIDILKEKDAPKFPRFKAGQALISIRAMGIIAVVDFESEKVVWAYQGFWRFQHAASFLPNGNLLVLDNQGHIADKKKHSRVIELNPNTLGVEWAYLGDDKHPFTTEKVGRLQRLGNGNTLIADSQHARIFEVTKEGEVVWNYRLKKKLSEDEYGEAIFTATRYSESELPFLKEINTQTASPLAP